jgi:hypothetical protein
MPTNSETLNRQLYQLLSKYKPKPLDAEGKSTPVPDEADIFKFEFTKDGDDYGTVFVTLDDERVLTVYFGDDVANSPSDKTPGLDYDDTWSGFLHQLSSWRMTRGLKGFNTKNKDHVNDDMARRNHMRNKDKIAEGYYPMGKKASYSDAIPTVKIVIEHSRVIEEGEKRYRNINKIFLENQEGERYLLDTKKPGIARVYARHIAEGGKVNDDRWNHVHSLCEEYQKMAGFVRATRNGQFNESAQSLVNEGIAHYQSLRESLGRMTGKRGYNSYFENWTPSLMEDGTEETNLNELFVQETLDPRIESVMPILNRIHKKVSESVVDKEMNKLAEWADSLVEDESIKSNNPVGIPEGLDQYSPVTQAITRRILSQHPDLLQKHGPEKVANAIDDVAEFVGDVEEIGSSDVSGWVKQVAQSLGGHEGMAENSFDPLKHIEKKNQNPAIKQAAKDVKRGSYADRAALMKAGGVKDDRGPAGVTSMDEADSPNDPMRPQGKIIKSLRDIAIMTPTLTFQNFRQSGKESIITDAIMAAKQMKHYYKQQGNQGAAQLVYNLENEIDNFRRGYDGNTQDGDTFDLSDLMRGTLGKIQFQTKPGVEEDLDANQKRVGQLGPTEKVGKKGAVGKLVGANENFINQADQAVVSEEDEMAESILDNIKNMFKPKDPTPVTPITADDIAKGYQTQPEFAAQVKKIAMQQGMSPEDLIKQLQQQVGAGASQNATVPTQAFHEGLLDTLKKGVQGVKKFGQDAKAAGKEAWDEVVPQLKQDWKNPIKTAFAEEGEMDEGAHTQQDRDLNPNDYERKATDWSVDPIAAGTDRIHDKVSSMLDRLKKPASKPLNKRDTDIGSVLEAALPWEDDEEDKDDKKPKDTKGSDGSEHGGHSRAKHLAKNAIPKDEKEEVKEGQDDLDRILTIMNHRR